MSSQDPVTPQLEFYKDFKNRKFWYNNFMNNPEGQPNEEAVMNGNEFATPEAPASSEIHTPGWLELQRRRREIKGSAQAYIDSVNRLLEMRNLEPNEEDQAHLDEVRADEAEMLKAIDHEEALEIDMYKTLDRLRDLHDDLRRAKDAGDDAAFDAAMEGIEKLRSYFQPRET